MFFFFFLINFKNTIPKICLKFVKLLGMGPASSVGWKGSVVFMSSQLGKWGEKALSVRQFGNLTWCLRCIWGRAGFPKILKCSWLTMGEFTLLSAQGLTLAEVELKLLTIIKKSFKNGEVTGVTITLFSMSPVAQARSAHARWTYLQWLLWPDFGKHAVGLSALVEKTNSSGFNRGISSSTSFSARDETAACSLAFLRSFFSWIWGGFLLSSQVSAPWEGATSELPLAWLPDCPTRCLAPHCCLLRLWH